MDDQEKNEGGRPTKYQQKYAQQAYKLCLLGATDEDMAEFFEVDVSTISNWKNAQPGFLEAIKKGKTQADAQVAQSLFKRATGYAHPDVDVKVVDGEIIKTPLVKHYPPDTTASIFWLKNRQKKDWRDKQEQEVEVHGNMTVETVSYADAKKPAADDEQ